MIDLEEKTQPEKEETFAELLEEYEPQRIRAGDYLAGEVLSIDEEFTLVDIGAKQEAIVPARDLEQLPTDYVDNISVGDQVPVYVTRVPIIGDDLTVSIQKGLEQEDWERAEKLFESQEILKLEIIGHNKGGVLVQFDRLQGFVPNSHIPHFTRGNLDQTAKAKLLGDSLAVQVLQVNPARKRLVFSARAATQIRREECLQALQVGQTVNGLVKNMVKFGVFVDLGGIDGLVHISELDWKHVDHPSEVLKLDEEVTVLVKEIDRERGRISLSRKALLPSPWQQFADQHEVDELIEGLITSIQDYGAFVQLSEDIVGLLHISEVEAAGGSGSPREMFRPGDKILTRIVEIQPSEERIRLSTRRVSYEEFAAWATQDWKEDQAVEDSSESIIVENPSEPSLLEEYPVQIIGEDYSKQTASEDVSEAIMEEVVSEPVEDISEVITDESENEEESIEK